MVYYEHEIEAMRRVIPRGHDLSVTEVTELMNKHYAFYRRQTDSNLLENQVLLLVPLEREDALIFENGQLSKIQGKDAI